MIPIKKLKCFYILLILLPYLDKELNAQELSATGDIWEVKEMSKLDSNICCVANIRVFVRNNTLDTISFCGWSCGLKNYVHLKSTFRPWFDCDANFPTMFTFPPGKCDTVHLSLIYIPIDLNIKRGIIGRFFYHFYPDKRILGEQAKQIDYWLRTDTAGKAELDSLEQMDKLYERVCNFQIDIPRKFRKYFSMKTYNKYYREYDKPINTKDY